MSVTIRHMNLQNYDDAVLSVVFTRSCEWFNVAPETPSISPSVSVNWKSRIIDSCGEILYATPCLDNHENEKSSLSEPLAVLGFLISYLKDANDSSSRHIWIAATNPGVLRSGIMTMLLERIESSHDASFSSSSSVYNDSVCPVLTINTYPKKFPVMYKLLEKRGYVLLCTIPSSKEGESGDDGPKNCYERRVMVKE